MARKPIPLWDVATGNYPVKRFAARTASEARALMKSWIGVNHGHDRRPRRLPVGSRATRATNSQGQALVLR